MKHHQNAASIFRLLAASPCGCMSSAALRQEIKAASLLQVLSGAAGAPPAALRRLSGWKHSHRRPQALRTPFPRPGHSTAADRRPGRSPSRSKPWSRSPFAPSPGLPRRGTDGARSARSPAAGRAEPAGLSLRRSPLVLRVGSSLGGGGGEGALSEPLLSEISDGTRHRTRV